MCVGSQYIFAQDIFTNEKRAQYIVSFAEHVEWDKISETHFSIGIVAHDSLLYYKLQAHAEQKQTIHAKPIHVFCFSTVSDIQKTHVLFLNNPTQFDIHKIQEKTANTNTLLITENFPFNKSMINFIVVNGKRNYEINEQMLTKAGLKINPIILLHAVKTKEDWEKLYTLTEKKLIEEQSKTEQQTKIINIHIEDIKAKEVEISELQQSIQTQKKALVHLTQQVTTKQTQLESTLATIKKGKEDIEIQELQLNALKKNIAKQQSVLKEQSTKLHAQDKEIIAQFDTIEMQNSIIIVFIIFSILVLILAYVIYRQFKITKKFNIELARKNTEIQFQRDTISEQNKQITDSIVYARRIQYAILPPENILTNNVVEHFILFKPRDIVSGDYYWMTQINDLMLIIAADCTGHGVPGAFMSLLGITFLNEIVHEKKIIQPHHILFELRIRIKNSLNKENSEEEYKDGMDMAVCLLNTTDKTLSYAGAYNPLYIIHNNELIEIKADKMPVGLSEKMDIPFQLHNKKLHAGDTFYMFSDGYADQFGGPNDKKFMSKAFKKTLLSIQHESMKTQKEILDKTITDWKGNTEQIDDILIVGIKI